MRDTKKRSLIKTLSYRALATLATIPFTGLSTALQIHLVLSVIYFAHERLWCRIGWQAD
jgi:uncharacterized membrane protein